jgi:hypothetical protein
MRRRTGGVLGHIEVHDVPAMVSQHDEDEEDAEPSGWHDEEIERDQVSDMIGEERSPSLGGWGAPLREQPGDGTFGHIDAKLTVSISPWILEAPQRGFAAAMRMTRALISAWTGGRPPVARPESRVQYARKRRRCHRRTVAGDTMTNACLQPAQTLASPAQRGGPSCAAWAEAPFVCTRRAAGAGRRSPGRAASGHRRGRGRDGASGASG